MGSLSGKFESLPPALIIIKTERIDEHYHAKRSHQYKSRNNGWQAFRSTPDIKGHRIAVSDVVIWHERMGQSADEIATQYGLSLSDIYAALAYYYDHQQEIGGDIRESEQWVSQLREAIPSKIIRK